MDEIATDKTKMGARTAQMIMSREAVVGVIGLGYVGLSLTRTQLP